MIILIFFLHLSSIIIHIFNYYSIFFLDSLSLNPKFQNEQDRRS